MAANSLFKHLGRLMAACIAVSGLLAAEHHGTVKSGGLTVPGATVTATQGDKKLVTTSDDDGAYSFPELADGTWTIDVEMLGFGKLTRDVGIASDAPPADWDLKLLPPGANLAPTPAAPAAPAVVTPAPPTTAAAAPATPATPATATAAPTAPATTTATATPKAAPAAKPQGRGNQTAARGTQAANGGRPSLTQAMASYQRVDVNATDGGAASGVENGVGNELASADLNQSAADSLLVNGSMSAGLNAPQQNDWFGGPGGMGMGMGGPGGMGMGGPGGMGGDNPGGAPGAGGPGGGPGGGGRGMGGPGGGGGGRGGGGGFAGGFGGRGGGGFAGGGRGGRGGPGGRGNVAAFGNARRNPRMQYNGNASFTLDNSVWDAQTYSLNGQQVAKPAYANSSGSVMFGGPIKIPKLLKGNNGMFTINYQMRRSRNGTTQVGTMPTA